MNKKECIRINCPRHSSKKIILFDGKVSLNYDPDGKAYGGREFFFVKNGEDETVTAIQYVLERNPSYKDFKKFSTGTKCRSRKGLRPVDGIKTKIGDKKHRMTFPELYKTTAGDLYTPNLTKNTAHKIIGLKIFYRPLDELINKGSDSEESDYPDENSTDEIIKKALDLKKLHPEATQKLQRLLSKPLESNSLLDSVD